MKGGSIPPTTQQSKQQEIYMAYRTKRKEVTTNLSKPLVDIPEERNVKLKITNAVQTDSKLKLVFENTFNEKFPDTYNIDGPRFSFLMAAVFSDVEEMKNVLDSNNLSSLKGKEITADIIKDQQHDIRLNPRDRKVTLTAPDGSAVETFTTPKEAYEYVKLNNIITTRNKITNHRSVQALASKTSVLPADKRF